MSLESAVAFVVQTAWLETQLMVLQATTAELARAHRDRRLAEFQAVQFRALIKQGKADY